MALRPDEKASLEEIERDQRVRGRFSSVGKGTAALGSIALGAGFAKAGGDIASRLMPFFNEYVPVDLAVKGISKISPKIGNFLKKGMDLGLDAQEGLQFVKQKMTPPNENIVEKYSPDLHQFILSEIQKGRSPLEAGALATLENSGSKGFKKIIEKITKDHNASWSSILETAYGQQQPNTTQQPSTTTPQRQPGQGEQALMSILEKINQRLGQ